MASNLAPYGMITGQDSEKLSRTNRKNTKDSIKSPTLLTVLHEAITLSTEKFTGPKEDRFSDILVTLKQSQQQLQLQTPPPLKNKISSANKAPIGGKNHAKLIENLPLVKADKQKLGTAQTVKSTLSKESSLTEKTPISAGKGPNESFPITPKENVQLSLDQTSEQQISPTVTLYDTQMMKISQLSTDEIGLNLPQQIIMPLNEHPMAQDKNRQEDNIQQQPLRDQLTQWINEGKVQIQKVNAPLVNAPLDMNREIVGNTKELIPLFNEETTKQDLNLGDIKHQMSYPVLTHKNTGPQQAVQPINPSLQESASQKITHQANTTPAPQEVTRQVPSPVPVNSQDLKPSTKTQDTTPRTDAPRDSYKAVPQTNVTQPVVKSTDRGGQKVSDPKLMDKSLLQKVNTLEEGGVTKTMNGQNRVPQTVTNKVDGKINTSLKNITMAEKVQALQQVKSQMKAALQKGETHMLVKLTPDDLGKVDIKLDISRDGTVSALFKTDNRETMILLSKYADDLRQIFGESGLNANASGMNFSSSDQQSSPYDQIAQSIGKKVPIGNEHEAIIPPSGMINTIYSGLSGDRRLNITV